MRVLQVSERGGNGSLSGNMTGGVTVSAREERRGWLTGGVGVSVGGCALAGLAGLAGGFGPVGLASLFFCLKDFFFFFQQNQHNK